MFGWTGKILRVNLSEEKVFVEDLKPEEHLDVLGGRGLGAKILASEVDPGVEPLGRENKIVLMTGPLTGTGANSGSVCAVVTKSALTKTIVSASSKLYFGAELKAAGYDGLVIEGKAKSPVYLDIRDDQVEILPADFLEGQDTEATTFLIRSGFNDPWVAREVRVLCIGAAGERRLPLACLVTDGILVADSGGIGAVFGSKNLKAIAVRGTKDILFNDGKSFIKSIAEGVKEISTNQTLSSLSSFSSYFVYDNLISKKVIPSLYFSKPYEPSNGLKDISAHWARERGCFACPIACFKLDNEGESFPELDAFIALGPLCGFEDPALIKKAYHRCLLHGIDPVETGAFIASLMRLNEMNVLEQGAFRPVFGEESSYFELIEALGQGKKEIVGLAKDVISLWEGVGYAQNFIGVRGKTIPFNLNYCPVLALNAITHSWPTSSFDIFAYSKKDPKVKDVPAVVKGYQDTKAALESLGVCAFLSLGGNLSTLLFMLKAVTGLEWDEERLLGVGETTLKIEHEFNQKAGGEGDADNLSSKVAISGFEGLLSAYYQLRGWS